MTPPLVAPVVPTEIRLQVDRDRGAAIHAYLVPLLRLS